MINAFSLDSVVGDYLSTEAKQLRFSPDSLLSFPRSIPLTNIPSPSGGSAYQDIATAEPKSSESKETKALKPKWLKI